MSRFTQVFHDIGDKECVLLFFSFFSFFFSHSLFVQARLTDTGIRVRAETKEKHREKSDGKKEECIKNGAHIFAKKHLRGPRVFFGTRAPVQTCNLRRLGVGTNGFSDLNPEEMQLARLNALPAKSQNESLKSGVNL